MSVARTQSSSWGKTQFPTGPTVPGIGQESHRANGSNGGALHPATVSNAHPSSPPILRTRGVIAGRDLGGIRVPLDIPRHHLKGDRRIVAQELHVLPDISAELD